MNTNNLSLEELSLSEMKDVEGGAFLIGCAVIGAVWGLTGLYDWGYQYASRQFDKNVK